MTEINTEKGRMKINIKVIPLGDDLCVIISGGTRPHIGCVTSSVPRPSLSDPEQISATTSVLNLVGHKDDDAARYVSHALSACLNKNVSVVCGVHVDNITSEEIEDVQNLLKDAVFKIIKLF
ncbi:MAG: hypothetical protein HGA49_07245 [Eubacteriaceae bacterium]|nr:hypothetical protein [Eubacteriaceae bacterium]